MNPGKKKALEAAGFRVGDAEDFLGLTDGERRLVALRASAARVVRRLREGLDLTQQQLAARIGSSQSRVAKIEAASPEVSLDLMFRGLFALGGTVADLVVPQGGGPSAARSAKLRSRPASRR
jgi:DNA-binding XRE family transcriptional regulator